MGRRNNQAAEQAAQRERERQQRERERQQREAQQRAEQQRRQAQQQREAQQRAEQQRRQAEAARQRQAAETAKAKAAAQARIDARKAAETQPTTQKKDKPNNTKNVKAQLRQAAEGGITKQEFNKIVKQTGQSAQKVIQKLDTVNKALRGRDKAGINLNSGAANMLITQAQKQTPDPFRRQGTFGSGRIGKALQGMIGDQRTIQNHPSMGGTKTIGTPGTGLMIGGTMIRPGGRVAVRPQTVGAAPAAPPPPPGPGDGTGDGAGAGDGGMGDFGLGDFGLGDFGLGDFGMPNMGSFEPISSDFQTADPLQLAALGQSYLSDMIRARQRQARSRSQYMRGAFGQGAGNAFSPLAALSIGGLTL